MKKSWIEFYALAVCFACVICLTITTIIGLNTVVKVYNPEFALPSYQYSILNNNDAYWKNQQRGGESPRDYDDQHNYEGPRKEHRSTEAQKKPPPEKELTALREAEKLQIFHQDAHGNHQTLVCVFIVLLVTTFILCLHIRLVRKTRRGD